MMTQQFVILVAECRRIKDRMANANVSIYLPRL